MNRTLQLHLLMLLLLSLFSATLLPAVYAQDTPARRKAPEPSKDAFAVVEFFSSEACIRCRQTSELANQVVATSGGITSRVFLMSFHIDYLNSLSWRDPYSEELYSQRQEEYVRKIPGSAMSPGSFILNGRRFLSSSSPVAMQRAVIEAKKDKPLGKITLRKVPNKKKKLIAVAYVVSGLGDIRRPFFNLHLVAVQPKLVKEIPDGVNEGETLTHVNLVRLFETRRLATTGLPLVSGTIEMLLPIDLDKDDVRVIAYIQDPQTLHVINAQALE